MGQGLDVGGGDDPLSRYKFMFPRIRDVFQWEHQEHGDGTDLAGLPGAGHYDFVHSSHSLEHMRDPWTALTNWLGVLKPGGHIVAVVPDWTMYEHERWPSENSEHTHAFTMGEAVPEWLVNVMELCLDLKAVATVVKVERLESTFDWGADPMLDQTCWGSGAGECAIEMILRKN